jgi:hypothetical protein
MHTLTDQYGSQWQNLCPPWNPLKKKLFRILAENYLGKQSTRVRHLLTVHNYLRAVFKRVFKPTGKIHALLTIDA